MDFSVVESNTFVVNSRLLGEETFLDLGTDKMIIKKHGILKAAKKVKPSLTQRYLDYALRGEPGFSFMRLTDEDYKQFESAWDQMAQNT